MIDINKICACIVLFNPNIDRLIENLSSVKRQVDRVYLVNNGSENIEQIKSIVTDDKIELINLYENKGIAYALNYSCDIALKSKYEYILTLDQDSVCLPGLIKEYTKYLEPNIAQVGCLIKDRNDNDDNINNQVVEVDWMITSGTLMNLSIWQKIGGFDSQLFIDLVDTDYGLSVIENGYKNIVIPFIGLLHEIGHISKSIKLFGKKHPVYNHNAFRRYYICRNNIIVAKKHNKISVFKTYIKVIFRIFYVFIFERDKFKKLKAGLKGLKAGMKYKIGKE